MAVRLSVVMVHAPARTASAERTAEAIVGELIGRNGFDLTLVGPLDGLGESSADRISLGSLAGDVAVLDWQSPADTVAALARIGLTGQRSRHALDPSAPQATAQQRRIYAFDLTQVSRPGDVIEALCDLKSSCQVRTFTLGTSSTPPPGSAIQPPVDAPQHLPAASRGGSSDIQKTSRREPSPAGSDSPASPETLDLDDLVDRLDRLDP